VSIQVDGVTVLDGSKLPTRTWKPGDYRLTVRFRSLPDVPARLQLWWQSPTFDREPIPAWRLGHLENELTPAAKHDLLAARGRLQAATFGCARCHAGALPAVTDPPPGPSLADAGKRLGRNWLMAWLADPANVRPDAHMPALFAADRAGADVPRTRLRRLPSRPGRPARRPGDA
jgi:hypothetical protein